MTRKIKQTRANKSILLKALAPYYYREKALGHSTEKPGRLILKINALPADKKVSFSAEEIFLMRKTINRLRNERLAKGQYTAMRFSGATGRIRTSGLPGRRTTTGRYRPALKRKIYWFCTVEPKTRKSPLLVVTTGFSGISQGICTAVVKWWSKIRDTQHAVSLWKDFTDESGAPFQQILS